MEQDIRDGKALISSDFDELMSDANKKRGRTSNSNTMGDSFDHEDGVDADANKRSS
jgi:hypothetical protein